MMLFYIIFLLFSFSSAFIYGSSEELPAAFTGKYPKALHPHIKRFRNHLLAKHPREVAKVDNLVHIQARAKADDLCCARACQTTGVACLAASPCLLGKLGLCGALCIATGTYIRHTITEEPHPLDIAHASDTIVGRGKPYLSGDGGML